MSDESSVQFTDGFAPAPGHMMAEQIVIGASLVSRDVAEEIAAIVQSRMFHRPAHQAAFAAVERLLAQAGTPVEPSTVITELARFGDVENAGGGSYLHSCYAAVPVAFNGPFYAAKVRDDYRRRNLWEASLRVAQMAGSHSFDPETGFDQARAEIDAATTDDRVEEIPDLGELTRVVLENIENGGTQPGLRTGFADLDAILNGLRPMQLIVIAARPAMGKSVIGLNIAARVAIHQRKRVHFHSLEMSRDELVMRMLAAESKVALSRLMTGQLEDHHWERLAKAQPRISDAPLIIDDSPGQSVGTIRGKLRSTARHDPAALAVIDYTQLLKAPNRVENRQQEVSEMVRGLKDLAKEFGIPIVALAQVNRNPESRADKRPQLADLRETGEFENAADAVILLHREDAYEHESPRAGEMDLIVAKQRNGPTGTITVASQFHWARAVDMAPI